MSNNKIEHNNHILLWSHVSAFLIIGGFIFIVACAADNFWNSIFKIVPYFVGVIIGSTITSIWLHITAKKRDALRRASHTRFDSTLVS